ncbi:MAG: hypothetical protein GY751_18145 [Bacteroidetes bacterium]|nr:hypothetical protein [Bacteroidota bacterium]
MMIKTFLLLYVAIATVGCAPDTTEVDKIITAKHHVKDNLLNYPDTADFHDMDTSVSGNSVFLRVTATNAFGTPETLEFNITVENGRAQ